MKCKECNGQGGNPGTVSNDGGQTWNRFDRFGQEVFVTCRECNGAGYLDDFGNAVMSLNDYNYAGAEG